jgi:glycine betaine/proline transport system substrate-binding protein
MRATRYARGLAGTIALSLVLGACAGGGGGGSAAPSGGGGEVTPDPNKETVDIAVNPWVGYEANAAVVGYLLETRLGYPVEFKDLAETVSWEGFETGEVDAILENWGHAAEVQTFITEKKVAVDAGSTGVDGIIGWFVPPWLATEHPDILDWNNLNKYAENFKTSESGDKGQLLDGDPSFVTSDEGIINGLGLDFQVVYAGSEAALIEAFRSAEQNKTWLIGYFYSPQWFLNEVPLKEVKLPEYTDGCDADATKITCGYAPYNDLNKIVSQSLVDKAPEASEFIKNFSWSAEHQNTVANYITNEQMDREAAAKKWVDANPTVWQAWLPAG